MIESVHTENEWYAQDDALKRTAHEENAGRLRYAGVTRHKRTETPG